MKKADSFKTFSRDRVYLPRCFTIPIPEGTPMKLQAHLSRLGAALLVSALAAAATLAPAPAAAQATTVTTNETIPFTDTRVNPCNQDLITFSGELHVTNHVTSD